MKHRQKPDPRNADYATQIATLLAHCLTDDDPDLIKPLTAGLGCTHAALLRVKRPPQPGPEYEPIVASALVATMHKISMPPDNTAKFFSDVYAILSGLSKNSRWRLCTDSAENIHAFAALLAYFDERCDDLHDRNFVQINHACMRLRCAVEPDMCTMLNDWIQPSTLYKKMPPANVLAHALFGAAWCSIVLDADERPWEVARLIRETCPPLVPTLMPEAPYGATNELPALDGYES